MNETEAIELAQQPHKIISAFQCNEVLGFLNGHISDMALADWELETAANNNHEILLHQEGKSVALKEAEWKNSKEYRDWRELQLQLKKFRAYRNDLRRKEEMLSQQERFTPKHSFPSGGF